jgi:hypothetical protein
MENQSSQSGQRPPNFRTANSEYLTGIPLAGPDFEAGLMQQHSSELQRYHNGRDNKGTVAPYVAPTVSAESYRSAAHDVSDLLVALAPGVAAISVVGGLVWVVVSVVSAGVAAVFAFVSANAIAIGGGIFGFAVLVVSAFGIRSAKEYSDPSGGNSGEWEYYQEQRQGWRKKQ